MLCVGEDGGCRWRGSALVACSQPGDVVGGRLFGVVAGLVAGVRLEPADVKADALAGSGWCRAFGKLDLRVRDKVLDRGGDFPVGEHLRGGSAVA